MEEGRKVTNLSEHRKMLDGIGESLFKELSDSSSLIDVGQLKLYYNASIPDLLQVFSDIEERTEASFYNYGPGKVPLVAVYGNWLVHIARVNGINYVIYPDWTHSKPIRGVIERIYVNGEWELVVVIKEKGKEKEVIVEKEGKKWAEEQVEE